MSLGIVLVLTLFLGMLCAWIGEAYSDHEPVMGFVVLGMTDFLVIMALLLS